MNVDHQPEMLIVDDEVNVALTLQWVLQREGYKIGLAHSCAEALALFEKGLEVDVVITDLNMEREDIGLEVAEAAKRLPSQPVVIVCTGYATTSNTQAALELHVDYLVTKPVDLDELKAALARLTTRRSILQMDGGVA